MEGKKRKFLVSAYGCEPNKGSEPGIGWQWCVQLAKFGEVHVITRSNNQKNIEAGIQGLTKDISENLFFYYYDTNKVIRKIKKGDHNLYPYYFCWQIGAYGMAKQLCRKKKFEYCIALTFGSIWMPTFMYKLPIPFIWGPVGGGEAIPSEYYALLGKKQSMLQQLRRGMMKSVNCNPLVIKPIKRAKYIIARTEDTASFIPKKYRDKVLICLETSIDLSEIEKKDYTNIEKSEKVKFIYTGRLINIKGLELIFIALAKSKYKDSSELILIGSGNQKGYLNELAKKLKISDSVKFIGKLDRPDLLKSLRDADVYIFPSLKEGGTWALMEGMGAALPVICLDSSGMHVITDEECAIRISVGNIDDTIEKYKDAINIMCEDADLRRRFGLNARKRIEEKFNWDEKGKFFYENILLHEE